MKHFVSTLTLIAGLAAFSTANADAVKSHDQMINVSEAYIPGGFSADTDAYVVVSGMYPNSCYRYNRAEVSASGTVHEVRTYATVSETMCLMVLVPYTQEVKLGRLASGEHTLRFMNGDNTYFERKLVVE